jgi:hypothetical protein
MSVSLVDNTAPTNNSQDELPRHSLYAATAPTGTVTLKLVVPHHRWARPKSRLPTATVVEHEVPLHEKGLESRDVRPNP